MRKLVSVATVLFLLVTAIQVPAAEKMTVTVRDEEVSVQIGKTEYITDLQFESLKAVRIWRGCDDLFYEISPDGMNIECNYGKPPKEMTRKETSLLWIGYQKKFLKLKDTVAVRIIGEPKL